MKGVYERVVDGFRLRALRARRRQAMARYHELTNASAYSDDDSIKRLILDEASEIKQFDEQMMKLRK
jgi:hypothetical protein